MPHRRDDPDKLDIAHVLFMDIVGYSRLSMSDQEDRLARLQKIVRGTAAFRRARTAKRLLSIATGDGMALVFFREPIAPVRCAIEIGRGLKKEPTVLLRMGIHSGPVLHIADINRNQNVAGGGINTAQRIMDCGDEGHILLSRPVADVLTQLGSFEGNLHDWGEVTVKHGERVHVFSLCLDDLGKAEPSEKVGKAGSPTKPTESGPRKTVRNETHGLSYGPFVHKLCDRSAQVNAFTDALLTNFKQRPRVPQFYFIHGEEKECHDSLVERLVNTRLRPLAEKHWGAQKGTVLLKKTMWALEGSLVERQQEVKRSLFCEFDPTYMEDDLSASALRGLATLAPYPLVVIRHNIHAEFWDRTAKELLEWYFDYWSDLTINSSAAQFVIFCNVIYPRTPAGRWLPVWLRLRKFNKEKVRRELYEWAGRTALGYCCEVLKELVTPKPHEVGDWFSEHNIYDEKRQCEVITQLFERAAEPVSMADIEHELRLTHQSFIKERFHP